jgi:biopolymer transport protein ExbD
MKVASSMALVLAVALAGCGKHMDPKVCRAQAEELGRFLAAADQGPSMFSTAGLASQPSLPSMSRAQRMTDAPSAHLEPDGIQLGRRKVVAPDELHDALAELRKAAPSAELTLAIDAATPWAQVEPVLTTAGAVGFDRARFVFVGPTPTPPPHSAVDDELDRMLDRSKREPSNSATDLAALMARVIKDCPPLQRTFGAVSSDGGDKAQSLIAAIPPALIECGCEVDLPSLRSMMWRVVGSDPALTTATVTLSADGEALAIPGATPWREASQQLVAATKPVHPTIAP